MDSMDSLPKNNWIKYLLSNPTITFQNKKEKKNFLATTIEAVIELIAAGKIGKAVDNIDLGLYVDKETFLALLQKERILRHSTYLSKKNPVSGIANQILQYKDFFKLSNIEQNYFQSLINLTKVYNELNKLNSQINQKLLKFKTPNLIRSNGNAYPASKIKALLSINELNFISNKTSEKWREDLSYLNFHSKEEISEAVSFLVARYNSIVEFKDYDTHLIDSSYAVNNNSQVLVMLACRLIALKKLEIEVEVYEFRCVKDGNTMLVLHEDENFEKSIELANIQFALQNTSDVYYNLSTNTQAALLADVAVYFHKKMPQLFTLKKEPYERYVLGVPTVIYSELLAKENMEFFREEINIIADIAKELLIPFKNLKQYELRPNFTLYDFLKILRFFILQSSLFSSKMSELIGKVDDELIYRSLIAVFSKEELIGALELISSREKVITFLDMVTWDAARKNGYLDLQYTPIILFEGNYIISTCVIGKSNLTRNVFLSERKEGNNIKVLQNCMHLPIADVLTNAFKKQFFLTAKEVPIKYKAQNQSESDIDFMAYRDGVLFIAECKDTIQPTDLYEMRTTFDYVKKAVTQLDYISTALNDQDFLRHFCNRHLACKSEEIKTIQCAIVLSNNKFYGHQFSNYPIRNVKELSAYMLGGFWNISLAEPNMLKFRLWESPEFKVDDLLHFCSHNSPHQTMYNACNKRFYDSGSGIIKRTHSLDLFKTVENLKHKYLYEVIAQGSENNNSAEEAHKI